MGKYRLKSVIIIEAYRLNIDNLYSLAEWCGGVVKGIRLPIEEQCIDIQTLEGEKRAEMGDYIIKGVKGDFYLCRSYIFDMTYELVERV